MYTDCLQSNESACILFESFAVLAARMTVTVGPVKSPTLSAIIIIFIRTSST